MQNALFGKRGLFRRSAWPFILFGVAVVSMGARFAAPVFPLIAEPQAGVLSELSQPIPSGMKKTVSRTEPAWAQEFERRYHIGRSIATSS